ncbi:hypothetical protein [Hungatella hathewayi]|uniref:hypothetical protein n=1 Tax=Hungatella hathewayi TaxID=154046 RepID=UPI003565AC0E
MRNYLKNSFIRLMQTITDGFAELDRLPMETGYELLADMQNGIIRIGTLIEEEGSEDEQAVIPVLEEFCEHLYLVSQELERGALGTDFVKSMRRECRSVISCLRKNLTTQYEIVFMPYKASMWDSLESIYCAAKDDHSCKTVVMPVPYFNIGVNRTVLSYNYEMDQFPPEVELADYRRYNLKQAHPDVIFIHNPYDGCNLVTQVPEEYFSSELVKYTDHLVYVPYKVCTGNVKDIYCTMPGVSNSWRTFVQSEKVREVYLKYNSPEKIVAAGSPKFDKVISYERHKPDLPEEWKHRLSGKKVFLLNTHLTNIMNFPESMIKKLRYLFSLFRDRGDAALLWRPHPLSIETINSMKPGILPSYLTLIEEFGKMENGIYDETPDVHRAIAVSDAYLGDWSSLVAMYEVTGKPVMVLNICAGEDCLLERYKDSLRASAFCLDEDNVFFTYMGNNELYTYDLKTEDTVYIGCFNRELYRELGMVHYIFKHGEKLFLSGGDKEELHAVCSLKKQTMRRIERKTAAYPVDQITNCLQWKERIYIITRDLAGIGYVNLKSEQFIEESAVFSGVDISGSLTISDSVLSGDRIILLSSEKNVVIIYQLRTRSVEVIELGHPAEKMMKICVEDDEIYMLSTEMKLHRYKLGAEELEFVSDIGNPYKDTKRVRKILRFRESLFIIPISANSIYKLDIRTGKMEELKYPDDIRFDSDDIYPRLSRFADYKVVGSSLLLCPWVTNQMLTLNMENGEITGKKIPLPSDWNDNETAEERLTMSYRNKKTNSIYYEEYYGISKYIDIVLEANDRKAKLRQRDTIDNFCNGESGVRIWNYVRRAL